MARAILAVVAGALVWAVLWIGGTQAAQAAFPDVLRAGQPLDHAGALTAYIVYSVLLSILAGYVTATIARRDPMRTVWVLAALQLALGIAFEASAWSLTPVWYHLVFLALIVPATLYGGRIRVRRRPAPAAYLA